MSNNRSEGDDVSNTIAYFGDGVYAECTGFHILLTANGVGSEATDSIYLEPQMLRQMLEWQEKGCPDHWSGRTFSESQKP